MSQGEMAGRIIGAAFLILLSALFSGLTLGVLGLDVNELEILRSAGTPEERRNAATIQPVRAQGNMLLCTLVLGNVAVTSLSSIVLAELTSGYVGFAMSTALIVVFGEIVPQAVCARFALTIGARFVPIVRFFIFLFYPLTKPMALLLDYCLGEEIGVTYSRAAFMKLVSLQVGQNLFHQTEANIIGGALTFRTKLVKDVATPSARMFSLNASDRLDYELMERIFRTGYSRIPVWDDARRNIVGTLYAKDLVLVTPEQRQPVISVVHFFGRSNVNVVDDVDTLETTLKMFISTRQHFAVVRTVETPEGRDPEYKVAGLVTLEDILEEILGEELVDEYEADGERHRSAATLSASALTHVERLAAIHEREEEASEVAAARLAASATPELSSAEVRAIAANLITNVVSFSSAHACFADVEALVRASRVVALSRVGGSTDAPDSGVLFQAGVDTEGAAIVLRGHISWEGSSAPPAGPWEMVLEEALASVTIPSAAVRAVTDASVLIITRHAFTQLITHQNVGQSLASSANSSGTSSPRPRRVLSRTISAPAAAGLSPTNTTILPLILRDDAFRLDSFGRAAPKAVTMGIGSVILASGTVGASLSPKRTPSQASDDVVVTMPPASPTP
jgi:metal transporter CNNM